jgi:hypothetical protein
MASGVLELRIRSTARLSSPTRIASPAQTGPCCAAGCEARLTAGTTWTVFLMEAMSAIGLSHRACAKTLVAADKRKAALQTVCVRKRVHCQRGERLSSLCVDDEHGNSHGCCYISRNPAAGDSAPCRSCLASGRYEGVVETLV